MATDRQVALITGCSSGIGKELALCLAREGYHVFAATRTPESLEDIAKRTQSEGFSLTPLRLDVASEESIISALEEVKRRASSPDVLVNNAGYGAFGAVEDLSLEGVRKQFEVNVFGLLALTKAVLPGMRNNRRGTIVNVSSIAGKISVPFQGIYCASKFAVEAISDALRMELKPFGINVIVIEPGPVKTNFAKTAWTLAEPYLIAEGSPYHPYYVSMRSRFQVSSQKGVSAERVARVVIKALRSQCPKPRYAVRATERAILVLQKLMPYRSLERGMIRYFGLYKPRAAEITGSPISSTKQNPR